MKISDLVNHLHGFFPLSYSENWDNVGLLAGDPDREITGILVCLDPTLSALDKASESNLNLIVSHHPPAIKADKYLRPDRTRTRFHFRAIERKIAHLAIHTNFDRSPENGLEKFAEKLKIVSDIRRLSCSPEPLEPDKQIGFGIIGNCKSPMNLSSIKEMVQAAFHPNQNSIYPSESLQTGQKKVKRIAFINGSGSSFIPKAIKMGAELIITGDLTHHHILDTLQSNVSLVDPGHGPSERFFLETVSEKIAELNNKLAGVPVEKFEIPDLRGSI